MEPVAIRIEIVDIPHFCSSEYIVIDHPKPEIVPAFGALLQLLFRDRKFLFNRWGTEKLRDFCNAVLALALDAKAQNPGEADEVTTVDMSHGPMKI